MDKTDAVRTDDRSRATALAGGEHAAVATALDKVVACWRNALASQPCAHSPVREIIEGIRAGKWRSDVAKVRELRVKVDGAEGPERTKAEAEWQAAKKQLPAISLSCDCQTREARLAIAERGIIPTGILQADLDLHGGSVAERQELRTKLCTCPHVLFCASSPSGDGLKAGLLVDGAGDPQQHANAFRAGDELLQGLIGMRNDAAVKDPQRLLFVTDDPDVFVNANAVPLVPPPPDSVALPAAAPARHVPESVRLLIRNGVGEGERNATGLKIACQLRDAEMSEAEAASSLREFAQRCRPPLPEPEAMAVLASAYKRAPRQPTAIAPRSGGTAVAPKAEPSQPPPPFDILATSSLPPVQLFDYGLLPDTISPWVRDIVERMQCPPDFPAVTVIIALGGLIGRKLAIRPKRLDDWEEVANLWGMIIGRPGIMKTPAILEALRPLHRYEDLARQEYDQSKRKEDARQLLWEEKRKAAQRSIQAAFRKNDAQQAERLAMELSGLDEAEPVRRRYVFNDASIEKFGELLAQNPNGLVLFRDELTGFLNSLEKDGHETDRAFMLEAWSGKTSFTYDRIKRGTLDIPAAIASIIGGIQPGPLGMYLAAAAENGVGNDGFIQRFQLAVFPDICPTWTNVDRHPDVAARQQAEAVFDRVARLDPAEVHAHQGEGERLPFLHFEPDAQDLFDAWREKLELKLRAGDEPEILEAHLSKFRKLVPSLALILHLAGGGDGDIGIDALKRAIAWSEYLLTHARRIYASSAASGEQAYRLLAKKILAGELPQTFTAREVYRHGWTGLTSATAVETAQEALAEYHWGAIIQETTGGRPKAAFVVSPLILAKVPPGKGTKSSPVFAVPPDETTDRTDKTPIPGAFGSSGSSSPGASPDSQAPIAGADETDATDAEEIPF